MQAKCLKDVENENARLKKLVAELSLDNSILKEVAEGKYYAWQRNGEPCFTLWSG